MHEVFLCRLAAHPKLRKDENFKVFLEYKQEVRKSLNQSHNIWKCRQCGSMTFSGGCIVLFLPTDTHQRTKIGWTFEHRWCKSPLGGSEIWSPSNVILWIFGVRLCRIPKTRPTHTHTHTPRTLHP